MAWVERSVRCIWDSSEGVMVAGSLGRVWNMRNDVVLAALLLMLLLLLDVETAAGSAAATEEERRANAANTVALKSDDFDEVGRPLRLCFLHAVLYTLFMITNSASIVDVVVSLQLAIVRY